MAVKMLACMSSKTLEEAIEVEWESAVKTPEPRSESKSDRLRFKTRSFTGCHTLIHPSWSFKSLGHQSASPPQAASPRGEGAGEVAWGKQVGKGWKRFFAALQCSTAPLRSADVRSQVRLVNRVLLVALFAPSPLPKFGDCLLMLSNPDSVTPLFHLEF